LIAFLAYNRFIDKGTAMANSIPSGKPGKQGPATKRLQSAKGAALKAVSDTKLRAGAKLLTQAVSAYAEYTNHQTSQNRVGQPHDFHDAYASMIQAVPEGIRLDLLRQMRRDLDEVARSEFNVDLEDSAANDNDSRVNTADFVANLERQQVKQRESDLASERLLPGTEMRARLGITTQALSAALKARRLFAMQGPSGKYAYPAFFADPTYDRPILEKVCKALGDLPGASKWDFFTSPRISLDGKTPLDALAKGKVEAVLSTANAFREE
jgi:hypothetical protein